MSLFVGLDVGTQSVKLLAYDPDARACAFLVGEPLRLEAGPAGEREQDPAWWVAAIEACFAAMPSALRSRVRAIGVSGQQHGFVPLSREGRVLAPAKLWCDTSTEAECGAIMEALGGPAACVATAGNPILAGYTASKLPWTRRHRPEAYADLETVLLPHDYINFWLTGERWMECGDASGTGWLDVRTRRWSPPMLEATDPGRDLSACLPSLAAPDALVDIRDDVAVRLGLPRDVRISVGGGDNMMAAIGTGNVRPGRLTISLGTSGTLFAHADRPMVDPDARWAAFCDSTGGWLPLVCTMNCTVATETVAAMFGIEPGARDGLVAATPPGADGLLMLPFLNGERTPDLPSARGSLFGMRTDNFGPAHLYRAAMEGATFSLRNGYEALLDGGMDFDRICLTGGGSRSSQWRQMVADVFDLPVDVPAQAEGAAFGAALQALWACGRQQGEAIAIADLVDAHLSLAPEAAARPDAGRAAAYRAAYRNFLAHLDAIAPLYRTGAQTPSATSASTSPKGP